MTSCEYNHYAKQEMSCYKDFNKTYRSRMETM